MKWQVKTWVLGQPCRDTGVLVGALLIEDHVHLQALGHLTVGAKQEIQELGVAVAG